MRIYQKKEIFHIISSLQRLNKVLKERTSVLSENDLMQILIECQDCAVHIGTKIEEIEGYETNSVRFLEEYCEEAYQISINPIPKVIKKRTGRMGRLLSDIMHDLEMRTDKKIHILFLPYKASMWTAFDSIWRYSMKDPDAEVKVVPIPYYEIGEELESPILKFEGDLFPDELPTVSYREYSIEREKPDLIFIHNPYDNTNNLTKIPEQYFSESLKQHTGGLIYSPYFTMCGYTKGRSDFQYLNKGTINADKVIVQSDFVKRIYESYGYPSEKFIAFGSPKIDAVINFNKSNIRIPDEWERKLKGKKVFLLNTHLSYFPIGAGNVSKYGFDFAQRYHDELLKAVMNREDCGLIWRPHPLLFTMIESRFPQCRKYVENMKKRIQESENCVIDISGDYRISFFCSDALITTYSSIINEYIVTGKPVMIFQTKPTEESGKRAPVDMRFCYFKLKKDGGMSFEDFINMVLRGEDPKYKERMQMLNEKAFANLDGSAGEKIYNYLKDWIKH
ncbi:MAG: hypothetical protein HFG95_04560 [Dorea sp.]|jgi:hypothetical protein|nr:hypothetical protein [Dorea sp.]